jgi:hypothetical protein
MKKFQALKELFIAKPQALVFFTKCDDEKKVWQNFFPMLLLLFMNEYAIGTL